MKTKTWILQNRSMCSISCLLKPKTDIFQYEYLSQTLLYFTIMEGNINPLKPELNPICYLLALLGAHHFLHVSRIRVKLLTLR